MTFLNPTGAILLCVAIVSFTACQQQPPPDTRAADESAVREADAEWSKAAAAKNLEGFVSYFADDGVMLPSNAPMSSGKEAIRTWASAMLATPGFSVNWRANTVEASRSGDLAYSVGTYELTMNDPKGKPILDRGKYVTVWKKQADGGWKVVVDTFNSDLPPAAP